MLILWNSTRAALARGAAAGFRREDVIPSLVALAVWLVFAAGGAYAQPACPTRPIFAGPPGTAACSSYDGDQTSCESAYQLNETADAESCFFDSGSCVECDATNQGFNVCTNACLCGNNVVDPGEVCDGGTHTACPGPCQSDCQCPPPLDHFTIYPTSPSVAVCVGGSTPGALCSTAAPCVGGACQKPRFYSFGPLQLTDQFRTADYKVIKREKLGVPANKNGEGIFDANTHLRQYQVRLFGRCVGGPTPGAACVRSSECGTGGSCKTSPPVLPRTTVHVKNQCQDALIDVTPWATQLLLPANKSLTDPVPAPDESQHQVDHFLCYKVYLKRKLANGTALPAFPKHMQVEVADQLQTLRYDLRAVTRICNPVAKQEDAQYPPVLLSGTTVIGPKSIAPASVRNPSAHLVCYSAYTATRSYPQTGCGATNPSAVGASIQQSRAAYPKGVFVIDQFGSDRSTPGNTGRELCIPSLENICGNNLVEGPEICDGTANAACDGMACRADCTCTPPTCGDNIRSGAAEACDGTDKAACNDLPCLADCSCSPPSCGDNIINQPIEACDGTDDSACPGQCSSHCLCPGPACTQDPTRTIYAGPPGLGCFTFNGNQALCESAYWNYDGTNLSQCLYNVAVGTCYECDALSQVGNQCINTCQCGDGVLNTGEECDGAADTACPGQCLSDCRCPPPACTQAPARTFVGWEQNGNECSQLTDQASCEASFYARDTAQTPTSCYFDSVFGTCGGCNPSDQSDGDCTNVCACGNNVTEYGEECDGTDHTACDGRQCGTDCRCLPPSCGDNIVNNSSQDEECDGTDDTACPGQCTSNCLCFQACPQDPSRTIFIGPAGSAACHQFDNDQTSCEHAYLVGGSGTPTSCFYAGGTCSGCGPNNESSQLCTNACLCGDNAVQDGETCDGTANSACDGLSCRADCTCTPPSCGDNIVNQGNEACDGTADSACPGQCAADCTCP
jgi:hypothetical protein